jgi:hypothetical protein
MKIKQVADALIAYYKTFSHSQGSHSAADLIVGYPPPPNAYMLEEAPTRIRVAHVQKIGASGTQACWCDAGPGLLATRGGADLIAGIVLAGDTKLQGARGGLSLGFHSPQYWIPKIRELVNPDELWDDTDEIPVGKEEFREVIKGKVNGHGFLIGVDELDQKGLEFLFDDMAARGATVDYSIFEHLLLPGLYDVVDAQSPEFEALTSAADKAFEELG